MRLLRTAWVWIQILAYAFTSRHPFLVIRAAVMVARKERMLAKGQFVPLAQGQYLDNFALEVGLKRHAGEPDEAFRDRVLKAYRGKGR